ncbi:MAG: PAS domain-containing protein [Acidimicrobiia bacterium]
MAQQQPMEIILLRQWAGYVATSVYITDDEGALVYYNQEAADRIGVPFEDVGEIPAEKLAELFATTGPNGESIPNDELPLMIALTKRIPAHRSMQVKVLDGSSLQVEVTALPIVAQSGRLLGGVVFSWEVDDE